ncbi:hypothetical protein [Clostridium acetobutylicum]|uniref:hypothetical protein n=1 Tax=Clostridium acetobutylicum TaxID=1488 RepID=UPI0018287BF6|nr:hypothetical protein [Clostridium acetobutylicum]NYC94273.1 hypothetical protein [Clostridium acetobutylicum]
MQRKKNEEAVMYIGNMSEEEKIELVKSNVRVLKYIKFENQDILKSILCDKLASDEINREYIVDFLETSAINIDKIKFIHKYGSKKAKMYTVDYKLSM